MRKQIWVVKPDTTKMRWSRVCGIVTLPATRKEDPGRPYHVVIDNVDDMQRIVTHLKNAIQSIEEARSLYPASTEETTT